MILDLSCGLPPFGRVPGFRLRIAESKVSGVPPEADQVSGKKNKKAEI
jgi:hypothetical protein